MESRMNKTQYPIKEILACLLTFALFFVLKDAGAMKYLVLSGVSGIFFLYGISNYKKEYLVLGVPSVIYIAAGMVIALIFQNVTVQSFKEICFAVIPLGAAISFFMVSQKEKVDFIKWQYWAMILMTLLQISKFNMQDLLETQYAFVFGVYLLYYLVIKGDFKYVLLTAGMLYLMNKRIALLAVVMVLALYGALLFIRQKKPEWEQKIPGCIGILASIFFCGYLLLICTVNLEGQFIQDLTSGRSTAWEAVKESYQLSAVWPGLGLGNVVTTLGRLQLPSFTTNLHNDLLKILIEIGTIGYIVWLVSHFWVCRWFSKNRNLGFKKTVFFYLVIIYTLLNYMTDNILVYVNYWFPVYLILLSAAFSGEDTDLEKDQNVRREYKMLVGVILAFVLCILGNVVYVYIQYKENEKSVVVESYEERGEEVNHGSNDRIIEKI